MLFVFIAGIINDILDGIDDSYEVDITLDRQLAIETAVITLGDNECLLIAGKGHETICLQ
jgi:UDP-N-acetylmuramoyl-L-alanyl-D-glutamate--2,6-diaminopimelate ligase